MNHSQYTLAVVVLRGVDWERCPARDSLIRSGAELHTVAWSNGEAILPAPSEFVDPREDGRNPGVGPRYLWAANHAAERGDRFVLLLDQDFQAPADWWNSYSQAVSADPLAACWAPRIHSGGVRLSPFSVRRGLPRRGTPLPEGSLETASFSAINSGLLIRVEALLSAASELTAMPLDFSDYALFHRLARSNARMGRVPLVLEHSLSSLQPAPTQPRLDRFEWFCRGARAWARLDPTHRWPVWRWSLGRALLLFSRSGLDARFLSTWNRRFRQGSP